MTNKLSEILAEILGVLFFIFMLASYFVGAGGNNILAVKVLLGLSLISLIGGVLFNCKKL